VVLSTWFNPSDNVKESVVAKELGTADRPLRVAIIGAGPSGFYAAGALLQQKEITVSVDMFDRLPTPYGLVRYGVAPDHQKIKSVIKVYERTAADPRFRFYGNVDFGADVTHADLRQHYDQIVYAVGAQSDRKLNIPGEDLRGSLSATEFVAWYNGHPDFVDLDLDLSCETAIVVGVGNVAMDVARVLAKSIEELKETDIADHALEVLAASNVKDIYVLSRRGPAQVKFTPPEIKEFGELAIAEASSETQRNLDHLRDLSTRELTGKPRRVHFAFQVSPVELIGDDKVTAVRIEKNRLEADESGYINAVGTGEYETIPAGLVLRSVGYKGLPLEDVPYDKRKGTIPNDQGRVKHAETGEVVSGEYVAGWAKRGPSGVIGTNKPDAVETVQMMLADLPNLTPAPQPDPTAIDALLEERQLNFVTMEGWRILDQIEVDKGKAQGRPRVKFTRIQEMLEALHAEVHIKAADMPQPPQEKTPAPPAVVASEPAAPVQPEAPPAPTAVSEPVVAVPPAPSEVVQPEVITEPPAVAVLETPAPAAANKPTATAPAQTTNGHTKTAPAKSSGGGLGALLKKLFGLR
jgi:ferredoxin--NADP+ reductase